MHGEDEQSDGIDPWDASLGAMEWSPGVDYIGEWAEARGVAAELRDRLIGLGVPAAEVTTEARTGTGGVGAVRTTTSASVARLLLCVLEQTDKESLSRATRNVRTTRARGAVGDPRAADGWYGSGSGSNTAY
jgi:hypothetical protein